MTASADSAASRSKSILPGILVGGAAVVSLILFAVAPDWARQWPAEQIVPLRDWVTRFFQWLANEASFGLFTVKDLTRLVSDILSGPLTITDGLLHKGFSQFGLAALPWITVVLIMGIVGYAIGGGRLGIATTLGFAYLAVFGMWPDAMKTFSLVLVTVPIAALIGLMLGILATRNQLAERVLSALFDVMQATPHLAYLGPIAIFFGFGAVPGLIATAIFAVPPMARCTILGLRTVAPEIIESGLMSGCTPRQLLWRVQLPAAQRTLLVGLNQVIMQTLAMVVIASLIGASGLGHRLLFSLQQLQMGKAIEYGVAIVVIAILLDRISQALIARNPARAPTEAEKAALLRTSVILGILLASSILVAWLVPAFRLLPKDMTFTTAPYWDQSIRWLSRTLFVYLEFFRDDVTTYILVPIRNLFLSLPWLPTCLLVATAGLLIGGWRLAVTAFLLLGFIAAIGFWVPAMMTLYLTSMAVIICVLLGLPIGICAAHRPRFARFALALCDTLQTFPSFIYLIPVIMLFRVGDLASIIAIIAYAMVPIIRYTHLGLMRVPANTLEAGIACGCTGRQMLLKVELPQAVPEILLGLTQTIIMALFMTSITALIGSRDLGQEILKALPAVDTGRGLLAGLSIAAIGITATRLIETWAVRRKRELGLA